MVGVTADSGTSACFLGQRTPRKGCRCHPDWLVCLFYAEFNHTKGFRRRTAEPWVDVAGGTDLAWSHRLFRLCDELIRSRGDFLCRGLNFFRHGQNLFRHRPNSFRDGLNLFVSDKTFSLSDQSQSITDQTFSVADQSQSSWDLTFSMTDQTFSSGRKAFP